MLEELKTAVFDANLALVKHGLVTLTWGNASGFDAASGLVVIKPSGVDYDDLTADDMVVVDLENQVVEGRMQPSSDTATHTLLYREMAGLGGVVHTHSSHAVMFAQAETEIPCFGTTHADHFYGTIPVTRSLTKEEIEGGYEVNTGRVIIERFASLSPLEMPAVLVGHHGPFAWGENVQKAVQNAVALEEVARMALFTQLINPEARPAPAYLLDKHYRRKHGPDAYYGQPADSSE